MYDKRYKLRYLPLFYEDLDEKITYITEKLKNPKAASDLLDKVEKAILNRLPVAKSFEPYYVVIDDEENAPIMEVRRFLYNRQDRHLLI